MVRGPDPGGRCRGARPCRRWAMLMAEGTTVVEGTVGRPADETGLLNRSPSVHDRIGYGTPKLLTCDNGGCRDRSGGCLAHSNKHIAAAIEYALGLGWRLERCGPRAHCWGKLFCPGSACGPIVVYGTPRRPETHGRQIRRRASRCDHHEGGEG